MGPWAHGPMGLDRSRIDPGSIQDHSLAQKMGGAHGPSILHYIYIILYYVILYYISPLLSADAGCYIFIFILHYIILYFNILYYILYYIILYVTMFYYILLSCLLSPTHSLPNSAPGSFCKRISSTPGG